MRHGRLVVTGHSSGRSVFAHDGEVRPIETPGIGRTFHFWSANDPATYPSEGINPGAVGIFPPVGGARFTITVLDSYSEDRLTQVKNAGMHTSDSTDFALVTSGLVELELDDGVRVTLSAGDVVVQNGTRHQWRALGNEPATLLFVMVGAHRLDAD